MIPRLADNLLLAAAFLLLPVAVLAPHATVIMLGVLGVTILATQFKSLKVASISLRKNRHGWWALLAILALLIWAGISIVWTIYPEAALKRGLGVAGIMIAGIVVLGYILQKPHDALFNRRLTASMLVGFVLAGVIIMVEIATQGALSEAGRALCCKPSDDAFTPQRMGRGTVMLSLCIWPMLLLLSGQYQARSLPIILVLAACILALQVPNHAAVLSFVAGGLIYAATRINKGLCKLSPLLFAAGWLLVPWVLYALLGGALFEQILSQIKASALHRAYIWEFVLQRIAEQPFTGWGFHSSPYIPGGDNPVIVGERGSSDWRLLPLHPHNAVLQAWLELGLPGYVLSGCIIALVGLAITRSHLPAQYQSAGLAMLAGFMVIALLSFGMWQTWWLAGLFLVVGYFALATKVS